MALLSKDSRAASDRARAEAARTAAETAAIAAEEEAQIALRGIKVKSRLFNTEALPSDPEVGDSYVIAIEGIDRLFIYDGTGWSMLFNFDWGDINGDIADQTDLNAALNGKESIFLKNTGFNRNFGSAADTVTQGNDSRLSDSREWTADSITKAEAEAGTAETRRAWTSLRVREAIIAWWDTVSIAISKVTGLQAGLDEKEPSFNKNTGFNKNFGSAAGDVTEGNDGRLSDAREWSSDTVPELEAQTGTADTRRAWTAERVRQAIVAWWATVTLTKSDVGLDNVDNTSDVAKPVSTSTQNALDQKANDADISLVGKSNNYNDLLNTPDLSAFDSIEAFATFGDFPVTGATGVVYIANDTGTSYRWVDGNYIQITDKSADWGFIEGTLADQTDLQAALNAKEDNITFGSGAGEVTEGNDARLSNAREWTAATVQQSAAELGNATTRTAWTAQRVRQAIVAWWNALAVPISKITGLQTSLDEKIPTDAIVNDLTTGGAEAPLSAEQGVEAKALIDSKVDKAGDTMTGDLRVNARLTVDHKVIEQTFTGASFDGHKRFRLRLNANTNANAYFLGMVRFTAASSGSNTNSGNLQNTHIFNFIVGASTSNWAPAFDTRLEGGGFTSITQNRLGRNDVEILMERDFGEVALRNNWVMHVSVTVPTTLTTLTLTMEDVV